MARGRNSGAQKTTGRSSPETTVRKVTKLLVTVNAANWCTAAAPARSAVADA
jgi:hypothetical protein